MSRIFVQEHNGKTIATWFDKEKKHGIVIPQSMRCEIHDIFTDDCLHSIYDVNVVFDELIKVTQAVAQARERKLNRKWRRRFALLVIVNGLLWSQILL